MCVRTHDYCVCAHACQPVSSEEGHNVAAPGRCERPTCPGSASAQAVRRRQSTAARTVTMPAWLTSCSFAYTIAHVAGTDDVTPLGPDRRLGDAVRPPALTKRPLVPAIPLHAARLRRRDGRGAVGTTQPRTAEHERSLLWKMQAPRSEATRRPQWTNSER